MSNTLLYNTLQQKSKQIAVLIDPDKMNEEKLLQLITIAQNKIDYFFIGGSLLLHNNLEQIIQIIKQNTTIPVVLFPGNYNQISSSADAILLLSLISGRNAEFLIGQQVHAAPLLKQSNLEIISTGYILIDGNNKTSVQYISNTQAIPNNKNDIAACTALAGEQLGLKAIYLEAGSGALQSVPTTLIEAVKQQINIPLIVGGGIKTIAQATAIFNAGANVIVVGTAIEEDATFLSDLIQQIER
ncbi:MAG: geranylgeranylglyceryl/heptaprenylglyceryl phosphate synthase [Chitinophagales bacterium]|nr:geranylgeranylglyceryl/heptaprenylglyceryl phosphate synthase [Chitinophagales bacterium]